MKFYAILTLIFLSLPTYANLVEIKRPHTILSNQNVQYLGLRHIHSPEGHKATHYMENKVHHVFSKGRINIYELKKAYSFKALPELIKKYYFVVEKGSLENLRDYNSPWLQKTQQNYVEEKLIKRELKSLSLDKYKKYVLSLINLGKRNKTGSAKKHIVSEFKNIGINIIDDSYNVIAKIEGHKEDSLVIIGHMDTVRNTVGADDNASGAAGVLELARVTAKKFEKEKPEFSIYFVVSEDEEDGLLGAYDFVKEMERLGLSKSIKLALNMDMIAYNQNGIVDLETNKKNKKLAEYFATMAGKYTTLKSNLVLQAWGSDHIPFLKKEIPAILTIENWKTHTPCWHKSCDTFETLNLDYALEILKMNYSVILDHLSAK